MNTEPKLKLIEPLQPDWHPPKPGFFVRVRKWFTVPLYDKPTSQQSDLCVSDSRYDALLAQNRKLADNIHYAIKRDIQTPPNGYGDDLKAAFLDAMRLVGKLKTELAQK